MSQDIKSILKFEKYQVDNISFRLNNGFSGDHEKIDIDLNIRKQVTYDKSGRRGIVQLVTKVYEEPEENNYPYTMELQISGFFAIECDEDEECERLLNINAVAILFPYVRALISTYTANANVVPLILPAINVNRLTANN